jgi:DNA-binding MarR family transcriptional regulator
VKPHAATELDRIVHEPARLALMLTLAAVEEADFVYLQRMTGLTSGNIAAHGDKLSRCGYIEIRRAAGGPRRRTVYRLAEAGRVALATYREQVASLLALRESGHRLRGQPKARRARDEPLAREAQVNEIE